MNGCGSLFLRKRESVWSGAMVDMRAEVLTKNEVEHRKKGTHKGIAYNHREVSTKQFEHSQHTTECCHNARGHLYQPISAKNTQCRHPQHCNKGYGQPRSQSLSSLLARCLKGYAPHDLFRKICRRFCASFGRSQCPAQAVSIVSHDLLFIKEQI